LGRANFGGGGLGEGGFAEGRGPVVGGGEGFGESRFAGMGSPGLGQAGIGGGRAGDLLNRGDLNNFLGLPSDEGLRGAAGVTRNLGSGGLAGASPMRDVGRDGAIADGTAGRPFGAVAERGIVNGRYGDGFARLTPSARYMTAAAVRGGFRNFGLYGPDWYAAHPLAWRSLGWAYGAAWYTTTWDSLGVLLGMYGTAPVYYDYGNTITYQDGNVYTNDQISGTAEAYSAEAFALANAGAKAELPKDEQWMPLGVFALCKPGDTKSEITIQLAVDRAGIIRGNYIDDPKNETLPIQGSVDKKTQKIAFTVGDNKTTVLETGLYNLIRPEAPALIHFGNERTEQWLLVGVQKPTDPDSQ
jgi:hypothetical protein